MLSTLKKIFQTLNKQNIKYCLWKSNFRLDAALKGDTDIDILVAREHCAAFKKVLYEHGCKAMRSPSDKDTLAVEHYLGYDEKTGKLFHIHIHYQLVFGGRYNKAYRLPIEQEFLTSTKTKQGLKIVTPDLEIVIRVIRALLKYQHRDLIKDCLSIRTPGLDKTTLNEFDYFSKETTGKEIEKVLKSKTTLISPEIIQEFLEILKKSPRAGFKLYKLKKRLKRELRPYQRVGRFKTGYEHTWALAVRKIPFLKSLRSKKKPESGGALIALVGVDGSGKSTLARELQKWLSWKLEVQLCYFGTGESQPLHIRIQKKNYRIFSRLRRATSKISGKSGFLPRIFDSLYWLQRDFFYITIALQRYRKYRSSLRKVSRGSVIICDRYPLDVIHEAMKDSELPPMDGWRIGWMLKKQNLNSVGENLSQIEKRIYKKIHPPDYLIRLCVNPETSLNRKPELSQKDINAKILGIDAIARNGQNFIDIDTNQTFDKTLAELKRAVWDIL